MLIIGLAGLQGTGKDTVARYLHERYGFIKFAFSDALYREVAAAFQVDEAMLHDRESKEYPQPWLTLDDCLDREFARIMLQGGYFGRGPLAPRAVLQRWGTDYRRAQDKDYWVLKAGEWLARMRGGPIPERRPNLFVESGTRFENERAWIKGFEGNIWHIRRTGVQDTTGHVSAQALPVLPGERELWNNDTIERLHYGIDLLFRTDALRVRVEPPMTRDEMNALADQMGKTGEEHVPA